jgi:hypothetical protein
MDCFHTIAPYSAYWDLTGYNTGGLQRFPPDNDEVSVLFHVPREGEVVILVSIKNINSVVKMK